jgi:hypothetical protein
MTMAPSPSSTTATSGDPASAGSSLRCACGIEVESPRATCRSSQWLTPGDFNRIHLRVCVDCGGEYVRARLDWVSCLHCELNRRPVVLGDPDAYDQALAFGGDWAAIHRAKPKRVERGPEERLF